MKHNKVTQARHGLRSFLNGGAVPLLGALLILSATLSQAVADNLIGSRDISNESIRSQDIYDNTIRSRDLRDGMIKQQDLRPRFVDRLQSLAKGFTFRGEWQPEVAYSPGDVVSHDGAVYETESSFTSSSSFDPANWDLWAAKGEAGPQGPQGAKGEAVLSGSGAPASELGTVGDFYLNTADSTLFGPKTADGWGTGMSLVGPQGPQGIQGPAGTDGADGADGAEGPAGFSSLSYVTATASGTGDVWVYADCPNNTFPIGGGILTGTNSFNVRGSYPADDAVLSGGFHSPGTDGWFVWANNSSSIQNLSAYAICAPAQSIS